MSDKIFDKIQNRFDEIYVVEPTNLGLPSLTNLYKLTTGPLKKLPIRIILPVSFLSGLAIYLFLGYLLLRLASILQWGF